MRKTKGLATGLIIGAMGIALVGAVGGLSKGFRDWNVKDWFGKGDNPSTSEGQKDSDEKDDNIEEVKKDTATLQSLRIFASGAAVQSADGSVTKTITATVLPEDAPDRTVDWAIEWGTDAPLKEEAIGDYITVTPDADGSATAKVTCKKAFRGSTAMIIVTTRVGHLSATCHVSFEGVPTSLSVDTSSIQKDGDTYLVPTGKSSLAIALANPFNDIGDTYYQNVTATVTGVGKIITDAYNMTAKTQGFSGNEKETDLNETKDKIFGEIKYENKVLSLEVYKKVEDYYSATNGNSYGMTYSDKFKRYADSSTTPYWHVELKSGDASASFNFRIVSAVNSVSLSQNTIAF